MPSGLAPRIRAKAISSAEKSFGLPDIPCNEAFFGDTPNAGRLDYAGIVPLFKLSLERARFCSKLTKRP